MQTLIIINEGPYGNERSFNALRLANGLVRKEGQTVRVFLIGEGVGCALKGQKTPDGYYNVERMLKGVLRHGGEVAT
jgi:uncharacterized protein involved in oxidation of intracellular sulfur